MMPRGYLAGIILGSALVTLDGTATTIALPAIGREFSASIAHLQWMSNAPLLALAAMLLPAGSIADRFGRVRAMRAGLIIFVGASIACAAAPGSPWIVAAKLVLGVGGALVLPAALALLRAATTDAAERTRIFGIWAAWTGVAAAAGPILAGGLVDLLSWRAVFVGTSTLALAALALLRAGAREPAQLQPVPSTASLGVVLVLGGLAYVLMESTTTEFDAARMAAPAALAAAGGIALAMDPRRQLLFPRELLTARNCVIGNAVTFAFYFGMFGLSFLLALYAQQVLDFGALRAALVLLPISLMLLFAERFGRLAPRLGSRTLVISGAVSSAAGLGWLASGPHPLPFWSHLLVGTSLFGLGMSLSASALTHAAVAAAPERCAGIASGLNHAVVRVAGLIAIAVLGSIAATGGGDTVSAEGVQHALWICAAVVAVGGAGGGVLLRNREPGGVADTAASLPRRPAGASSSA